MPREAVSFLGAGDLYLDRLSGDGARNGLVQVGAALLSLQSNAEIKEQTAKGRDNYGQVIASATVARPPQLNITLTEMNRRAVAMAFLGNLDAAVVAAGSAINEAMTLAAFDVYFRLANRRITAGTVEVSRPDGVEAGTWTDEEAYAEGAFVVPVGEGNGHYYQATTGGTSGMSAPTWPTDGSTVTDGTVTWQDMGPIELTQETDFEVIDRTGMIKFLSDGAAQLGESFSIDYDYGAFSGSRVSGAVQPTIKAYLFLDGKNMVDGKDVEVEVWEAQLRPTSPIDFLADDFTTLELEGTPVTPPDKGAPFIITYED